MCRWCSWRLPGRDFTVGAKEARPQAPASLRAYELYLLGYEAEARLDKEHTLRAIPLLERAIELDPQFARAWTVLGWACEHAAQANWATDSSELASRRRAAVVAAAALDPRDPIAVGELGLLRGEEGDFDVARETIERALSLGRNHADALALLAKHIPTVLGRTDDALSIMERAFKLNPHPPVWYFNSQLRIAYFARDFEGTVHAAKRAPDSLYPHLFKTLALAQLRRSEELADAAAGFWGRYPHFDPGSAIRDLPIVHPPAIELYCDGLRKAGFSHAEAQECGISDGGRA
jgi:adenylate cyclase